MRGKLRGGPVFAKRIRVHDVRPELAVLNLSRRPTQLFGIYNERMPILRCEIAILRVCERLSGWNAEAKERVRGQLRAFHRLR